MISYFYEVIWSFKTETNKISCFLPCECHGFIYGEVGQLFRHFGPDWNFSTTIRWISFSKFIVPGGWIVILLVILWILLYCHQQVVKFFLNLWNTSTSTRWINTGVHGPQRMINMIFGHFSSSAAVLICGFEWNISTVGWMLMKLDTYVPLRVNCWHHYPNKKQKNQPAGGARGKVIK